MQATGNKTTDRYTATSSINPVRTLELGAEISLDPEHAVLTGGNGKECCRYINPETQAETGSREIFCRIVRYGTLWLRESVLRLRASLRVRFWPLTKIRADRQRRVRAPALCVLGRSRGLRSHCAKSSLCLKTPAEHPRRGERRFRQLQRSIFATAGFLLPPAGGVPQYPESVRTQIRRSARERRSAAVRKATRSTRAAVHSAPATAVRENGGKSTECRLAEEMSA
jgi:hypothetical protein